MSSTMCTYQNRDAVIVSYIYDELPLDERDDFLRHLRGCTACQDEVAQFTAARRHLAHWSPPSLESLVSSRSREDDARAAIAAPAAPPYARWAIPVWAQVAAAVLCLGVGTGVGAGLANLRITYGPQGVSITTGRGVERPDASASPIVQSSESAVATRAELAALEQQLRSEITSAHAATMEPARQSDRSAADDVLRRVRALVRESEQRQQRELALRVAEVARDVQAQRQADLMRIDRTLGVLQSNTGMAVRRQEQLLNSLAVRVSQRQ